MLTGVLTITIPGNPATKGSMKCLGRRGPTGHQLVDSHASTKPWMEKLATSLRGITEKHNVAAAKQPVTADVWVTLERPKSHYGTGRNARVIKEWALDLTPASSDTSGDVDKYARALLDGLQAADLLDNDAQVVRLVIEKSYVHPEPGDFPPFPGVRIRLSPWRRSS